MAHHKRRRPKNRRAGCLLCKPHKANHARLADRDLPGVRRRLQDRIGPEDLDLQLHRYDRWAASQGA